MPFLNEPVERRCFLNRSAVGIGAVTLHALLNPWQVSSQSSQTGKGRWEGAPSQRPLPVCELWDDTCHGLSNAWSVTAPIPTADRFKKQRRSTGSFRNGMSRQ